MMQPADLPLLKEVAARVGRDMSLVQGAGSAMRMTSTRFGSLISTR